MVRGMGSHISKTQILIGGHYRAEAERLNAALQEQLRRPQQSADTGTSSQVPVEPVSYTGDCVIMDAQEIAGALGTVIGTVPGREPHRMAFHVQLRTILRPDTPVFELRDTTIGQYGVGDLIQWPSYFTRFV